MRDKINSINNLYIKYLLKLDGRKSIKEQGVFLIEGKNIILDNVENGNITKLLVTDEHAKNYNNVETILVTPEIIKKLSKNKSNPGIIGVAKYDPKKIDFETADKILVLENINNPGNLGAIIRSAKAFDFKGIILLGNTVFPFNEKVIRSSQGEVMNIPIMELDDLTELERYNIYHFVLNTEATPLNNVEPKAPYALVFGNEANGTTQELLTNLKGENIFIEMSGTDSLSLPNAASIAMYKFNNGK